MNIKYLLFVMIAIICVSGCERLGPAETKRETVYVSVREGDSGGGEISFKLLASSRLRQVLPVASSSQGNQQASLSQGNQQAGFSGQFNRMESIGQLFNGTLTIKEGATTLFTYPVTVSIDPTNWSVQLLQTFVLPTGTFTFELVVTRPNYQYIGVTTFSVVEGNNSVPMEIFPVIGNTVLDTQIIAELASFKFSYGDIPGLPGFDPKLGIIIDSGAELIFDVSHDTGETETYVNIPVGPHTIRLKLYDGSLQKGKSVPAQESQTVIAGQTISMDIIPIYGVNTFAMTVGGGDASFDIKIPPEIVNQAGGVGNLRVPFLVNGPGTGYTPQEGEITSFTYDSSGDFYLGEIDFSGAFHSASIYAYVEFVKIPGDELIATCNFQSSLSVNDRTSLCGIPVTNSLISTGKILGVAGITVCLDASCDTLVGGSSVYLWDSSGDSQSELLGITGLGGAGNGEGYLRANLSAGTYTLRAYKPDGSGKFGDKTVTIDALGVKNVEIQLNASAPTNPSIVINGGKQYTYSRFATLTLSARDATAITDYYVSSVDTPPGASDWRVVSPSATFQINTAFQMSSGLGEKTVYAWFRNSSGHRSERVQSSITVQDDTSLYFSNFADATSDNGSPNDASGDSWCLALGNDYRIADWQEISTIISQDASVDTTSFKTNAFADLLLPSTGTKSSIWGFTWWSGTLAAPAGAYVTHNGNSANNGDYFAISEPSNSQRDDEFGWSSYIEPAINNSGLIQLYTVDPGVVQVPTSWGGGTSNLYPTARTRVLCYRDSGVHPLMNGYFTNNADFWDNTAGSVRRISQAMVLESLDSTVDVSRIEQRHIGIRPNTSYLLTAKLKTSSEDLNVTFGVVGATVTDSSYDTAPPIWVENTASVELAGEGEATNDYFFQIQLQITSDSTADQLTVYFEYESDEILGQSATIDDVTLD